MVSPGKQGKVDRLWDSPIFLKGEKGDTYIFGTPGYAAPGAVRPWPDRCEVRYIFTRRNNAPLPDSRDLRGTPLEFKPPVIFNRNITKKTSDIIIKAVAYEKEKRYQSALEMKDDICKALIEAARPKGAKTKGLMLMRRGGSLI